jgi:HD-GYP domain-containing protein (c-di-GMP phosphodiesterase class II)
MPDIEWRGQAPAPGGDDRDEVAFERSLGAQLLTRLHGLLRAARLYDLSNQALREQIDDMLRLLQHSTDGELTIVAMGQCFYLNGTRLRAEASQAPMFDALTREFEARGIGGIRFLEGVSGDELGAFIRLMHTVTPAVAGGFAQAMADAGLLRLVPVTLEELSVMSQALEETTSEDDHGERARARQTYQRAVRGTRAAILKTARTGKPPIRRVKRLVQPVVDSIMKSEYSIVGLTALRNHDEYTYAHCVNVSVLSIAMGQRLGLSRTELADLGVAALLHDIGKLTIPPDVLGKPGRFSPEEWRMMQRHPMEGLKVVSRMPGLSALTLGAMQVCLQHHRTAAGGGYPEANGRQRHATFARIVSVADCFDAMTAHRAYRRRPFTGYEALQQLLGRERDHFDPAALWALVRTIGLYPVGTIMLTPSGYMVLSANPNPADPARPHCKVLSRPDGSMPMDPDSSAWEPMPPDESVARVVLPEEYDFEVDQLLAA